eukprot:3941403-Rhodomonas_salina.5
MPQAGGCPRLARHRVALSLPRPLPPSLPPSIHRSLPPSLYGSLTPSIHPPIFLPPSLYSSIHSSLPLFIHLSLSVPPFSAPLHSLSRPLMLSRMLPHSFWTRSLTRLREREHRISERERGRECARPSRRLRLLSLSLLESKRARRRQTGRDRQRQAETGRQAETEAGTETETASEEERGVELGLTGQWERAERPEHLVARDGVCGQDRQAPGA